MAITLTRHYAIATVCSPTSIAVNGARNTRRESPVEYVIVSLEC
jgi:hypothetical protein